MKAVPPKGSGSLVGVGALGLVPFFLLLGEPNAIPNGSGLICIFSPTGVLAFGLGRAGRGGGFFLLSSLDVSNASNPNRSFCVKVPS